MLVRMPSVVQIAERAGVSIETVLRALGDHPLDAQESKVVAEAVAELGPPQSEVLESLRVLTRTGRGTDAQIEADEAEPVARHLLYVDSLIHELDESLDALRNGLGEEQEQRLDDAKLLLHLIVTTWRNVERRLRAVQRELDAPRGPSRRP